MVVAGVDLSRFKNLTDVVGIDGALGFFAHGAYSGNNDRRENTDDRDDREQFDEGKAGGLVMGVDTHGIVC